MPSADATPPNDARQATPDEDRPERRNQFPLPEHFTPAMEQLDLPTTKIQVTGRNWFVHYRERADCVLRGDWMIRTEPSNRTDSNAVAVFVGKRQVGYLPSGKASFYSRALNAMGGSLLVPGEQDGYTYWVHLPRKSALRTYARSSAAASR